MVLSEALHQLREDYLAGKDMLGPIWMYDEAITRICGDNPELIQRAAKALDEATPHPPGSSCGYFGTWIDGAQEANDDGEWRLEYHYDRKRAEIAGVIGRAMMWAIAEAA